MYNENERSHFFRDLIVKILLVLLFIFLLMWLFPMPNLNPFYDKIFTQNINSMTDAAKGYFTVARLPQAEGETKKISLGDMISNKMLIEFTDSEGKTCDKNKSYVEVTKKGSEYVFKTNLSCSTGEDYVIEYFGCYNVCENGECRTVIDTNTSDRNNVIADSNNTLYNPTTNINNSSSTTTTTKKVTEYQFYKTDKTQYIESYSCANGYTLQGNKCVKETKIEREENASINCSNGYAYNNSTKKCEKVSTSEIAATLSCPQGYIYATSMGKCLKSGDVNSVDATIKYICDRGTLVGTKCKYSELSFADAEKVYTCDKGRLSGTKCIIDYDTEDAEKVYSCDKGILNGTKCILTTANNTDAEKVYSCTNGTLEGTKCVVSTSSISANKSYSCSSGSLSGSSCVHTESESCTSRPVCSTKTYTQSMPTTSTPGYTSSFQYQIGETRVYEECHTEYSCSGGGSYTTSASIKYSCSQGTLSGSECIIKNYEDAKVSYKCSHGTLSGTKCLDNNINTTNAKLTYKCDHGTLSGTKCVNIGSYTKDAKLDFKCSTGIVDKNTGKCVTTVSKEVEAKKSYVCQAGTLEGTKCNVTNVVSFDPVYVCKYGTLSEEKSKTCVVTTVDAINPTYYCINGFTLAGTKCYSTLSSSDIVDANPIYKTSSDTVYKWSTQESLVGWTRTGKTRISEIVITSKN